ncbi:MAG: DUF4129 domain-containing protein, partial [Alicyclobacillaceae bacterium]|nr:DUF4129 domain-containing protein [Alicyclobacillaceae bacterium]
RQGWTYGGAKHVLHQVLSAPVFHEPPPATPWWLAVWRWLRAHGFPWLSRGSGHHAAWWLCAGLLAVAASAAALWRWRRRRSARVKPTPRPAAWSQAGERARRALEGGADSESLALLLQACLAWAADRGWIRPARYKTARRYREELAQAGAPDPPNPGFVAMFAELVEAAEAVRFAGRRLERERLERLCDEVHRWTEGVGS